MAASRQESSHQDQPLAKKLFATDREHFNYFSIAMAKYHGKSQVIKQSISLWAYSSRGYHNEEQGSRQVGMLPEQ